MKRYYLAEVMVPLDLQAHPYMNASQFLFGLLVVAAIHWGPVARASATWHFEFTEGVPSRLVWETEAGTVYDLSVSADLVNWVPVEGFPKPATGGTLDAPIAGPTTRYFRISWAVTAHSEFVVIPAGSFAMGDPKGDGWGVELPVHTVSLSAYEIGRYPVTKEQWDKVRAWGLTNGYTDLPVGLGKGPTHPVHTITWNAIVKWCNARSEMEALKPCFITGGQVYRTGSFTPQCLWAVSGYRLPTEAEWERAARGGFEGRRYPWGDTITHSDANYYSSPATAYDLSTTRGYHPSYNDGITPYTSPVGSFPANGFGLYDMLGNVRQWCWDFYNPGYYSSSPASDPKGPGSGYFYRVLRGGGWLDGAAYTRCSYRFSDWPDDDHLQRGFRLARTPIP